MGKTYKCRYANCKLGSNVEEKLAVKDGTLYYHPECLHKKKVKAECKSLLLSIGMIDKLCGIFLKKSIDDEGVDVDYLHYTIEHVVINKLKLNNPYGIKYYMGNWKIEKEYQDSLKAKVNQETRQWTSDESLYEDEVTFRAEQLTPAYLEVLKGGV